MLAGWQEPRQSGVRLGPGTFPPSGDGTSAGAGFEIFILCLVGENDLTGSDAVQMLPPVPGMPLLRSPAGPEESRALGRRGQRFP